MALSEAKVKEEQYARHPDRRLWEAHGLPRLAPTPGAFRGGGHDPSESRMRENRTSGLRAGTGHRTGAKAAGQRLLPAPTAGRASPRLYDSLLFPATESIAATWPDVNMLILQNRGLQPKGCASESKGRSDIAPPCKFLGISRLKASPLPPASTTTTCGTTGIAFHTCSVAN